MILGFQYFADHNLSSRSHNSSLSTSLFWCSSNMDDNVLLFTWSGRNHVLMKLKVRRGCTVHSLLIWHSIKKSEDTQELTTTGSMDGCSVMPVTQFVGTRLPVDTTRVLCVGGFTSPPWELPERWQSLTFHRLWGLNSRILHEVFFWSPFHRGTLPQDSGCLKLEFSLY